VVKLGVQAFVFFGPTPTSDEAAAATALFSYAVFAAVDAGLTSSVRSVHSKNVSSQSTLVTSYRKFTLDFVGWRSLMRLAEELLMSKEELNLQLLQSFRSEVGWTNP
jgi:hypothetical protein